VEDGRFELAEREDAGLGAGIDVALPTRQASWRRAGGVL
jgi:hypothetical protein